MTPFLSTPAFPILEDDNGLPQPPPVTTAKKITNITGETQRGEKTQTVLFAGKQPNVRRDFREMQSKHKTGARAKKKKKSASKAKRAKVTAKPSPGFHFLALVRYDHLSGRHPGRRQRGPRSGHTSDGVDVAVVASGAVGPFFPFLAVRPRSARYRPGDPAGSRSQLRQSRREPNECAWTLAARPAVKGSPPPFSLTTLPIPLFTPEKKEPTRDPGRTSLRRRTLPTAA